MPQGAILEFYNSATMYLTHNICKNKANVTYHLYFLLHVKDEDVIVVLLYFYYVNKTVQKRISSNFQNIVMCNCLCVFFIVVSLKCFPLFFK